ncbi:MAG: lyase family protein [bacterium]
MFDHLIEIMKNRIEKDAIGEMEIPINAYYGIATLRSKEYFSITKVKVHKQMIKSLAIIKKACTLSNYDAKFLSRDVTKAICSACDEVINGRFNNQFLTDAIQGGAGHAMNMNMNEVIANRANEMLGGKLGDYDLVHPLNHVNLSQSTNDVIPTAAKHAILQLSKTLLVELKKIRKCFNDKSTMYGDTFKIGRTHLQDSLPLSFGELFKATSSTIQRDIQRINSALEEMHVVSLGTGDIGIAGYSHNVYVKSIDTRLNEVGNVEFRKADNALDVARNMDEFVNLSHAIKLAAINLSKTSSDIRLMASYGEVSLQPVEASTGLLSGKVNPTIPEVVNQVCFQIVGKDTTINLAAEHGQLELNVFGPIIYENTFDSIEYMSRAIKLLREFVVETMVINEKKCKNDIVNTSAIGVTLLPKLGLDKTIAIIKEARINNISVRDIVLRDNLISEKELENILTIHAIKAL